MLVGGPSLVVDLSLVGRHALLREFRERGHRLPEAGQVHPLAHAVRLRELNVTVRGDLNPAPLRVAEVRPARGERLYLARSEVVDRALSGQFSRGDGHDHGRQH